jgi:hypothetical protein
VHALFAVRSPKGEYLSSPNSALHVQPGARHVPSDESHWYVFACAQLAIVSICSCIVFGLICVNYFLSTDVLE